MFFLRIITMNHLKKLKPSNFQYFFEQYDRYNYIKKFYRPFLNLLIIFFLFDIAIIFVFYLLILDACFIIYIKRSIFSKNFRKN